MSVNHDYARNLVDHNYAYRKLFQEHQRIETLIRRLETMPGAHDNEVKGLKKMKLSVVDQMSLIEKQHQLH